MYKQIVPVFGATAMLAAIGFTFAISTYPQTARAQTQGMERRDDRRDTRQDSRDVKQACKAGDENSRAECRQTKQDVKQSGRQDENPAANSAVPPANNH
jgi:hypothetical protein